MIPEYPIKEWNKTAPWHRNEQIEQDLIICRALIALFNDDYLAKHLAFRGGTALHKLYLQPQLRYSEDIDLVQINAEPIKETIDKIREVLLFLGEPKIKQKAHNNTLIFRFNSEISPVVPIRLKVEINTREHFNVLELKKHDFSINNQWFSGNCSVTTYHLEELLGTKLRALYQRRKGRDLFDLYKAISIQMVDIKNIIRCYREYIGFVVDNPPTQKEYLQNMELKMQDKEFLNDTNLLLRPDNRYNPVEAWELVKDQLIMQL
ncbi:MAG: nucleotidyl transferase AbiEii/AbiGii toxin family protein [Dysgonamonadaceae bacterium]|jgi:predicted nucleotidyltransferase component of viral defense system|nr:nucleotidyl transferase AbiEii/AbiGii toxin family protein [Dysgonamonadaceae bacterium]